MDDIPMLFFYRGQNVDDMTCEQLLDAVKFLGKQVDNGFKRQAAIHAMYHSIHEARKARNY